MHKSAKALALKIISTLKNFSEKLVKNLKLASTRAVVI